MGGGCLGQEGGFKGGLRGGVTWGEGLRGGVRRGVKASERHSQAESLLTSEFSNESAQGRGVAVGVFHRNSVSDSRPSENMVAPSHTVLKAF